MKGSTKLGLAALLLVAMGAARADDTAALKRAREAEAAVEGVVDKVVPAFVFIGGGSGVCISPDGYFLTNFHVVTQTKKWKVKTGDGQTFLADVVGTDQRGDLALLKMKEAEGRPCVALGDSDAMEAGERVVAVGNPYLLGRGDCRPTVTLGIVSANHRCEGTVMVGMGAMQHIATPKEMQGYYDCIQTDAAVNPGNSGGPLFNMKGELVGINGSISPRFGNRVNSGIGYSIPSNQIRRFLPRLKEGKGNAHGMVDGLVFSPKQTDLDGVVVGRVRQGSDAEKLGFQADDVIVSVEEMPSPTAARLLGICWTRPSGEALVFQVRRGSDTVTISARLTGIDAEQRAREKVRFGADSYPADGGGAQIEEVHEDTAAAKAGLKVGDVVRSIDGAKLKDASDLLKAIGAHKPGDKVKLHIEREGKEMDLDVTLEAGK